MSEIIHLELKYCECCGGLLLRRAGLNLNVCRSCQSVQDGLLPRRSPRPRMNKGPRPSGVVVPFRPKPVKTAGCVPDLDACTASEGDLA
jgi:hypothetical protein